MRRTVAPMDSVRSAADWPVETAAVAVVDKDGTVLGEYGPQDQGFPLASVTKLLVAYAVLIAVDEGAVEWDQPAGPEGSTLRHLVAHASGLAFDEHRVMAPPGKRRIYSSVGFEVLADTVHDATGIAFPDYLAEAVFEPLGMTRSTLEGSAGHAARSSCADLVRFTAELQAPTLLTAATVSEATTVAFPGLSGLLPAYGTQKPNDWGLGFEIRDGKSPHWTGRRNSPETYGHFGQSGTFLWVDPVAGAACVALSDRDFGEWSQQLWPEFSDAVLDEL